MASSTNANNDGSMDIPASSAEVDDGPHVTGSDLPLTSAHYGPMDDSEGPEDAEEQGDHLPVAKAKKKKKKKPKSKRGQVSSINHRARTAANSSERTDGLRGIPYRWAPDSTGT